MVIRASRLTERVVDGELVIYDSDRQRVHALNSTAAFIWSGLGDTGTQAAVVDLLCQRFPESRLSIEQDVAVTVERFLEEGLLCRCQK